MPQSERSKIIKDMLVWLSGQRGGKTIGQIVRHVEIEITDMGASVRTIRGYVRRCESQGLIECRDRYKFRVTEACKNWLERKVS